LTTLNEHQVIATANEQAAQLAARATCNL